MATVPKASPQVELRPLDLPYQSAAGVSSEAFGSGKGFATAGKAVSQASDQLYRISLQEQIEDNERHAKDLETAYRTQASAILFGDGTDGNPGYYGLNGENALEATESTKAALTKLRADIAKNAPNDRVRQMYEQTSAILEMNNLEGVARHTSDARQKANVASSIARIQAAKDNAAAVYNDPAALALNVAIVRTEAIEQAQQAGLSDEAIAAAVKQEQSGVYEAAISAAIVDNPDLAVDLFAKYRTQMTATAQVKLGRQVVEVGLETKAQEVADEAWSMPGSLADKRAFIRDNTQGELENKSIQQFNQRAQEWMTEINFQDSLEARAYRHLDRLDREEKKAEKEARDDAKFSAIEWVQGGGRLVDWQQQNPDANSLLIGDGNTIQDLQRIETAVVEGQMYAPRSDGRTLSELKRQAVEDPAAFANTDPAKYQQLLTKQENAQLGTLVANAVKTTVLIQNDSTIINKAWSIARQSTPELRWGLTANIPQRILDQRQAVLDGMVEFVSEYTDKGIKPPPKELQAEAVRLGIAIKSDPAGGTFLGMGNEENNAFVGVLAQIDTLSPQQKAELTVEYDAIVEDDLEVIKRHIEQFKPQLKNNRRFIEQLAGAYYTGNRNRYNSLLGRTSVTTPPGTGAE